MSNKRTRCPKNSSEDESLRIKVSNHQPVVIETYVQKQSNQQSCCDVVFSFDTTGSMLQVLDSVRRNLTTTVARLFEEIPGILIGIICHGDYCDYPLMCWKHDLSTDVDSIKEFITCSKNTSGGDPEECYEFILQQACLFSWKASVKIMVIIGDEEPHQQGYVMPQQIPGFEARLHIDWKEETRKLQQQNIMVFSCHAYAERSSINCLHFYQYISKTTNGYYFPLSKLEMFKEYMVAICLKAADGAETIQSLKQQQQELQEEIEQMMQTQQTNSEAFENKITELSEIMDANREVESGCIFSSPLVAKSAARTRTKTKTKSRVDSFIQEMSQRNQSLDESSSQFIQIISDSLPIGTLQTIDSPRLE